MSANPISSAQLAANQANAQLSTGPHSVEGKAKSSLNAVKTGLTGRTVVLPTEDIAAYQHHVQSCLDKWEPEGDDEHSLAQQIADTQWRLLRIPSLEAGIYALGRLEFAAEFAAEDPATRQSLIQAKTFLVYRRDLNNLSIQEARLRRQLSTGTEELQKRQAEHNRELDANVATATSAFENIKAGEGLAFDAEKALDIVNEGFGFEFSIEDIEACLESRQARRNGQRILQPFRRSFK